MTLRVALLRKTRPTILLFDVDGTLLSAGDAGRRAFASAMLFALGSPCCFDGVSFAGATDRAIARNAMISVGLSPTPERIEAVLAKYVLCLSTEVEKSAHFRVMPGVSPLLQTLSSKTSCCVGLGTENVREGARIKLTRATLFHWFEFGGFGCDHEDRAELLRIGALRGAARLGIDRAHCRVVVVGDTIRDVEAALAIGAECVAVGTSGQDPQVLLNAGASAVFADLTQAGVTEALLGR
jgi:phosphoglycolate phosphatase